MTDAAVACHLEQLVERFAHCVARSGVLPGISMLVESGSSARTPSLPSSPKRPEVDDTAFNRGVVYLKVAGLER